jgi:DNA polymerase III gamma/tau subunit
MFVLTGHKKYIYTLFTAMKGKYLFFCLFLVNSFQLAGQDSLSALCDSVFQAVIRQSAGDLQKLTPGYKDLRSVYDSSDVEMMIYQIGLRQKELEFYTRKDMKKLIKYARSEKIKLGQLEKTEADHPVEKNEKGYSYARASVSCRHAKKQYALYFTLIELNGKWFYGEGLRIEKKAIVEEAVPDYEAIDREAERKKKAREEAARKLETEREKARETEKKRIEKEAAEKTKEEAAEKKRLEKEEAEAQKAKEAAEKIKAKEALEQEKTAEKQKKQAEKEAREKLKAAEAEKKQKEKQDAVRKKESERKAREREKEVAREQQKKDKKEKEKLRKKEQKQKKRERKEAGRIKKKEAKKKNKEKKNRYYEIHFGGSCS